MDDIDTLKEINNNLAAIGYGYSGGGCLERLRQEMYNLNKSILMVSVFAKHSAITPEVIKKASKIADAVLVLEGGALESEWTKEMR